MRLSRPCYDKYWRCPGWAGGGFKYAQVDRCRNGRIQIDWDAPLRFWRFWRCNECDVVVLPYRARLLSPFYLWWFARRRVGYWWTDRRIEREWRRRQRVR